MALDMIFSNATAQEKKLKLPRPDHKYGYTSKLVDKICKDRGITREQFGEAFGINTCVHDKKLGTIYYGCDIERALHILKAPSGKAHGWD